MVHADDHDDHAVLGQVFAVFQHHPPHIADPLAVNKNPPRFDLLDNSGRIGIERDHLAVGGQDAAFLGDADLAGQLDMLDQVPVFAMNRYEKAGLHRVQHQLELFLAGVAGDMHLGHLFVEDLGAATIEMVDQFGNCALVAGNHARGEDHRVPLFQLDLLVIVHGDAGQGAHRLALAAGGDDADLFRRQMRQFPQVHQNIVRNRQVTQIPGDLHIFNHGATVQQDLAAAAGGIVGHLLHAMDAAGEGGHDDTAAAARKYFGKGFPDIFLGEGVALALHVGGIGQQRQHTGLAVARQAGQVGQLAIDRGMVDLEVAGMDHDPFRRGDGQRATIDHRVGHPQELHAETAQLHSVARLDDHQLHRTVKLVFLELFVDKPQRQGRAVDRHVQLLQHEGKRSDVILVPVGQADGADIPDSLTQPGDIGYHVVDSEHFRAGKHQAAIDDDDVLVIDVSHHVHADFAQSAQGHYLQRRV